MARALQSASLSFGLVTIPVKLYIGAHSRSVSFHLLHAKDGSRIHEQMVCQGEDKPVSRDELVKGFEVSKGQYVEITKEELNALEAESNRNVEIQEFVPVTAVDPLYFVLSIDTMGTGIFVMEGTASADGKTITLKSQHDEPGGGHMTHRAVWKIVDSNTQTFVMYGTHQLGKDTKVMEMTYTRKP